MADETLPQPLNATGATTPAASPGGTVTLVEGTTFCLSGTAGDIRPGSPDGLYFRDARVISRWELRLDGQQPVPLAVRTTEAFGGRFVLRCPPRPGRADSTLLVVRERLVGDGMRETVTVRNLGPEVAGLSLALHVDADFADLFAVKGGGPVRRRAESSVAGGDLVLDSRQDGTEDGTGDGTRGVAVSATGDPVAVPGTLSWRIAVPPRQEWTTEILVQPTVGRRRVEPQFGPGQRAEASGPARKIQEWRRTSADISSENPEIGQVLSQTETDLGVLRVHDDHGGSFVAAGAPWFMTLFGRDSLLTAMMALPLDPDLAVGTLQNLARTQGQRSDPFTEEEPGRIMHELRRGPDSARVLGGSHYYGTIDATPLFVMLLAEAWRWGADESTVRALLPAADAALAWIAHYGDRDGDGFVEYQRATDRGLLNQGWKDSADGINDAAGHLPSPPVALCEVQAYVYAALLARAALADGLGEPTVAERCRDRAARLRERFAEAFWLPGKGCYAVALDGNKRPLDAVTSNAAHCLWAGIAPDEHAARLVTRLAAADMDSGYGLRTLASTMGAYNPVSYHNGSVWPHDTAIAVAGLLRYAHLDGAAELARRLADGLLAAAGSFGGRLPELYCGFPRGEFSPPVPYPTSCSPQAWASAAPLLLVRAFLGLDPDYPRRELVLRPNLPASWGTVRLGDLALGKTVVTITARGQDATVTGLPGTWSCRIA
ncbi:MAG TPA: glycogen debranching N-terminal domain-containing protein [Trebonia sp.]|nr:glycogen debranching N-terminal domain-containing protein [Trebonia sp.]